MVSARKIHFLGRHGRGSTRLTQGSKRRTASERCFIYESFLTDMNLLPKIDQREDAIAFASPLSIDNWASVDAVGSLKELLVKSYSKDDASEVQRALNHMTWVHKSKESNELMTLKNVQPCENPYPLEEDNEGVTAFLLDSTEWFLGLYQRASRLCFVRDFMPALSDKILKLLTTTKNSPKVILTGNSGIGKSWFQLFLLHRLLKEQEAESQSKKESSSPCRFVLRQIGERHFFLYDLQTCQAYEMLEKTDGARSYVEKLLNYLHGTFYFFEPGSSPDLAPLTVSAPSFSTLPPGPKRIQDYSKDFINILYMPVWSYNELFVAVKLEKDVMPERMLDDNYHLFGGIIRYTLAQDQNYLKVKRAEMEAQCQRATRKMLTSIHTEIDDALDAASQLNLGGFVASYHDIPVDGDFAFETKSLTTTSEYARSQVRHIA